MKRLIFNSNVMIGWFFITILAMLSCTNPKNEKGSKNYDVLVYGSTPAGITASINAASEGMSVLLVEETDHIGGMTSGGLSHTDFFSFESLGGTWKEFMDRVENHYRQTYGEDSEQVKKCWRGALYEPKVAKMVFMEMLSEHENIEILTKHRIVGTHAEMLDNKNSQITFVRFHDLKKDKMVDFKAKVFIDATYEGDLMAAAGCEYTLGSEGPEKYNEPAATEKDWHVQCYNFRVTLTSDKDNSIPIPKPDNYNPNKYLHAIEKMNNGTIEELGDILQGYPMPNKKADFNDRKGSPISSKICNETDLWPEGSPEVRKQIWELAKNQALGIFYFLQNDPRVLPSIQKEMHRWGLPKDEFEQYGNFPPVIYVREGRRLVGQKVFTQHDAVCREGSVRAPAFKNAVAIGNYNLNGHGTYYTCEGKLMGNLRVDVQPFQLPYSIMLPRHVKNLLVPVAVSASRVGYGGIRMEPTWTALGQAAGLAAAQAVQQNQYPEKIDIFTLQQNLHNRGAITFYTSDVPPSSPFFNAVQYFGNQGLFQDMCDPDTVNYRPLHFYDPGVIQYREANLFHDINPDKKMSKPLAKKWLRMMNIKDDELEKSAKNLTRGEFLNQLYEDIE